MKKEDKADLIMDAGLKALATPKTTAQQKTDSSEHGKIPMPGSVVVPCKNKNCNAAIESGFVYNTEEWIEKFIAKERTCPACGSAAVYSRQTRASRSARVKRPRTCRSGR